MITTLLAHCVEGKKASSELKKAFQRLAAIAEECYPIGGPLWVMIEACWLRDIGSFGACIGKQGVRYNSYDLTEVGLETLVADLYRCCHVVST